MFISLLQLSSGKAGLLAAKMLVQCRSQLASDEEVASLWTASSLEWSTLGVPSEGEDIGEFLSRHVSRYIVYCTCAVLRVHCMVYNLYVKYIVVVCTCTCSL